MILNDFELACLYAAGGDTSKMEAVLDGVGAKLASIGLAEKDSSAVGAGYVITDAGKRFLAEHMNNRGIA